MKHQLLAVCAATTLAPSAFSAVMVTESFSGTGALVTPGNTGDHSGAVYTVTITETVGCADISFDVTVSVGTGPVHFDTRGFGDSGNTNDSFQTTPAPAETMSFELGVVTATPSAAAPAGSTLVSSNVAVSFTSFDLVDNGNNSPAAAWTTDTMLSGTVTSPGGGSGTTTTESGVNGATKIDIVGSAAWMWINNAQFEYSGDVVIDKVPEPTSSLLLILGSGFLFSRRKR